MFVRDRGGGALNVNPPDFCVKQISVFALIVKVVIGIVLLLLLNICTNRLDDLYTKVCRDCLIFVVYVYFLDQEAKFNSFLNINPFPFKTLFIL